MCFIIFFLIIGLQEGSNPKDEIVSQLLEIDLHEDSETEIEEKRARALRTGDTLALLLNG